MRFLTFFRDGEARVGVLRSERVMDITTQAKWLGEQLPVDACDLVSLIASGQAGLNAVRKLLQTPAEDLPLAEPKLLAPIPRPRKNVFGMGWNDLEHFAEGEAIRQSGQELPAHPVFFSKTPTAVPGPYETIPYDAQVSAEIDWEVELDVIVGKNGKNIPESQAHEYIFDYTVVNDISARDLQRRHGRQWLKGKSLDGAARWGRGL